MLVLGIDPGVRKLGYALVEYKDNQKIIVDSGILFDDSTIKERIDRYHKMSSIVEFFANLYTKHTAIHTLAIEKLYFTGRNQANAEFVYGIRAALILQALQNKVNIQEIDPTQIKKYITGNGKSGKELVQMKTMQLFGLQEKPQYNDSADALGLSYIGSKMS